MTVSIIVLTALAVGGLFVACRDTVPRDAAHAVPAGTSPADAVATDASPADAEPARVTEDTLTLNAFKVEELSFTPSPFPMDRVSRGYPYPDLERRRRWSPDDYVDRTLKTVVLENAYLKVTTLPGLGGRVFEAVFKPTGQQVFHRADRLYPFDLYECGTSWMFATGGLRFEFPSWGHDHNTDEPWEYTLQTRPDGTASVSYSRVDERTGLRMRNRISLDPGRTWIRLNCELSNPTDAPCEAMAWVISGMTGTTGVEFIMPATYAVEHGGERTFRWPRTGDVDWTYFRDWPDMQAFFALDWRSDFSGLYDHTTQHGFVRWARPVDMPGLKLWGAPREGDRFYVSLYGGTCETMEERLTLAPGEVKTWEELWYPLANTGGLTEASRELAVSLHTADGKLVVGMMPTRVHPAATVRVARGAVTLLEKKVDLTPAKTLVETVDFAGEAPAITVRVTDAAGRVLIDRTVAADAIRPVFTKDDQKQ